MSVSILTNAGWLDIYGKNIRIFLNGREIPHPDQRRPFNSQAIVFCALTLAGAIFAAEGTMPGVLAGATLISSAILISPPTFIPVAIISSIAAGMIVAATIH